MEVPELRLHEIRKLIGTPANGGAAEYRKRLYAETSKDKSLMQYLHWSMKNRVTAEMPMITVEDTLGKLSTTDFRNVPSVMKLRTELSFSVISDMDLAKDKADHFVVVADPEALTPTENDPKGPETSAVPAAKSSTHPGLLKIRTAQPRTGQPKFPTIVLPLGRLLWKDIRPISEFGDTNMQKDVGQRPFEETNYVAVVDAVDPHHPIWLIYNRNTIDESDNLVTLDPLTARVVFRRIGRNFDAAQLFPSARAWLSQYGTERLESLASSIQSTMSSGGITFEIATLQEVSDAMRGSRPPPGG